MATETVTDCRDQRDNHNLLSSKLAHLEAMLMMTFGNSRESFDDMSDEMRDNFLWACFDISSECKILNNQVGTAIYQSFKEKHEAVNN